MSFSIILLFVMHLISVLEAMSGSVVLDSLTFDKIITRFKTSLVKFDIQYPYGEKHEEFEKMAKMAKNHDLLLAEVPVQEFGEKENMDLAKRFGVSNDHFPALKLFIGGNIENPIDFSEEFTSDSIIRFVRNHSGIRIPLNMCLEEFDELAERFMDIKTTEETRIDILNEAKQKVSELSDDHKKWSDNYIKVMDKVLEKGNQFIDSETQRLNAIISGKLTENKKNELKAKLNVLQSFSVKAFRSQNSEL